MCSTAPPPATTWTRWPRNIWTTTPSISRTSPARGPNRSPSTRSRWSRPVTMRPRTPTSPCACTRPSGPGWRATGRAGRALPGDRDAAGPGPLAHGAHRGAHRPGPAGRTRARIWPGASPDLEVHAYASAGQPLQPGLAQADRRDLLQRAGAAGGRQDPQRRALHLRGGAGATGRAGP